LNAEESDVNNNFQIPFRLIVIFISFIVLSSCSAILQKRALIGAYKAYNKGNYWDALKSLSSAENHPIPKRILVSH